MNRTTDRHSISRGVGRSLLVCLTGLALSLLLALVGQAKTIYVDISNVGSTNDGTSWATAYTDLQFAVQTASSGDNIWVAKGTYTPGTVQSDSFKLKSGVALYGGYPTGGGQRDWANNETILSGEIGDSGRSDNCYHVVVTGSGTDDTAVLDGFTVSSGFAHSGGVNDYGGGMYNITGSPTVTNCTFSGNGALYGGGMYNDGGSPTVTNCAFRDNAAGYCGGMYNRSSSNITVTNCTFSGNDGGYFCGGMYNLSSNTTVTNCTFSGNTTGGMGGGIYNNDSTLTLENCTITDNTADADGYGTSDGGGIYITKQGAVELKNTILAGNIPNDCGGSGVTSQGYNLEGSDSCDCDQPTDKRNANPLLATLQDNGGPTETHALLAGSPGPRCHSSTVQ